MADSPTISDFCRKRLENGFQSIKKTIHDFLPPDDGLILDCGCGTGLFASVFPATQYVGIDVSERCIAAAKLRSTHHPFFQMNALSMSFDSHSFSRVFVVGLLHHLTDEESGDVVSEIHRILKPSGKLLVFEDIPSQHRWNFLGRAVHALDAGTHIRKPSGYRELLDKSFEVLSMDHLASGVMDYAVFRCKPRCSLNTQKSSNRPRRCESVPWLVTNVEPR